MAYKSAIFASLVGLGAISLVACGGKVIYVEGSGGAGGATSSTHTTTTHTTTTNVTSASLMSTVETVGDMVDVVATDGPGPNTSVSVGDVSPGCDDGQLGNGQSDVCNNCVECAISSACAGPYTKFSNDPDAQALNMCFDGCMTNDCFNMCESAHPEGTMIYNDLVQCLLCVGCPNNCNMGQPCMLPP